MSIVSFATSLTNIFGEYSKTASSYVYSLDRFTSNYCINNLVFDFTCLF